LSQLALPLKLDDFAVFESFWSPGNDALVAFIQDLAAKGSGPGCGLWGAPATGKTHLLQAVCERLGEQAIFVPLTEFLPAGPAILDGLASRRFICIDNIDAAAGEAAWEAALFALCNQLSDVGGSLVVAAAATPRQSKFTLADLESRLSRLPVFHIEPLAETDRAKALQLRAHHRGLDLPDETAKYILARSRRDMASLYASLDRLDSAALKAQRRLTIPFVRDVLDL
jgi:DnaA family protein